MQTKSGIKCDYLVSPADIGFMGDTVVFKEIVMWLAMNRNSVFIVHTDGLYFQEKSHATHFKLTFGGRGGESMVNEIMWEGMLKMVGNNLTDLLNSNEDHL